MHEPVGGGTDPTWTRLTDLLASDPGDGATQLRVSARRELLNQRRQFANWWSARIRTALADAQAVDQWLEMAGPM